MSTRGLEDMSPLARAVEAARRMDEHRQAMGELAAIRADALAEARASGMSVIEIAEALSVSRQAVHRVLRDGGHAGEAEIEDGTITVGEAAALVGLSPRRVYELIDAGRLEAKKVGRRLRIRRRDVEAVAS